MNKGIISLVVAAGIVTLASGAGNVLRLQDQAPERYVVVKGDTLWGIAGRFLREPWRWPEIWRMNREQIRNPHWIYPGDTLLLEHGAGDPRLSVQRPPTTHPTVTLSPQQRADQTTDAAIPSIPVADIEPFLSQPLVVEERAMAGAPSIVAMEEKRVIVGAGNLVYVEGLAAGMGRDWQIYRPGEKLIDPETQEVLGYEAIYLGDAQVLEFGEPSSVQIVRSRQEIIKGDRLVSNAIDPFRSYVPHAPDHAVQGRIISAYESVNEVGKNAIVTINRGLRDGLEKGNVLAAYRLGDTVQSVTHEKASLKLPNERTGLVFVFRLFEKVSYALVVQSKRPMHANDVVQTP